MLSLFKDGAWESLPDLEESLTPALFVLQQQFPASELKKNREQIELLLEKLALATETCKTRKQQIAPLVNALTKTQAKP